MTAGLPFSLADFGWQSGQSATIQHTKFQDAVNSGEPLRLPVSEVQIDSPIVMNTPGGEIVGTGASIVRCVNSQADGIVIQAEKVTLANFNIFGAAGRSGSGVIVGPNNGDHVRYVTLDRLWSVGHRNAIHVKATGGLRITGGMVWGTEAGIRWENVVSGDTGDNKIHGVDINSDAIGLHWTSGGGLYVEQCKLVQGTHHVRIDNSTGNTGSLLFTGNSFEGNTQISIDIMGNSWFNRLHIVGNSIGVFGCAIAVRNFMTGGGPPQPWLGGLLIADNTIEAGFNGSPLIDLGCCLNPIIGINRLEGRGSPTQNGIIIRPECSGGKTNLTGSLITGCATPYVNLDLQNGMVPI